jgi:predicted DCC family thiol-disulfide oxidoreductase YuxK
MYRREPGADAVRWVDIARCEPSDLGAGLSRQAALARLHLRRPDGSLVSGAAAFTTLWRALPRWSWLGRLFDSRTGWWLLEAGYRVFLAFRPIWRARITSPLNPAPNHAPEIGPGPAHSAARPSSHRR